MRYDRFRLNDVLIKVRDTDSPCFSIGEVVVVVRADNDGLPGVKSLDNPEKDWEYVLDKDFELTLITETELWKALS